MRVLHCITSLGRGGAEHTLSKLLSNSTDQHLVLAIIKRPRSESVPTFNTPIIYLREAINPFNKKSFVSIIKFSPQIIQGWMYHGDFIALCISFICPKAKLFWNIRHSTFSANSTKLTTRILRRFLGFASRIVKPKILSCSESGAKTHLSAGYYGTIQIVPNSYSDEFITPLSLENTNPWLKGKSIKILSLGRNSPQKNRTYFIEIVSHINRITKCMGFIQGRDVSSDVHLMNLTSGESCEFTLNDESPSGANAIQSANVLIMTSKYGEGFPNVLLEALVAGLWVFSTDVGDSRMLLEHDEFIIPYDSAKAASLQIIRVMNSTNSAQHLTQIRHRALKKYSLMNMIGNYASAWNT